ncbi:MAG: hypothetical protein J5556_04375, partial [Deltaproteobacteria bacterium]|nr:hypothetical protein [Deltaproteobacteria bacterium]
MKMVKTLNISSQLFSPHECEQFLALPAGLPAFDMEKLRKAYSEHVRKLEKYAAGIGTSSPAFQQRMEEIKQALDKNIPITSVLSSPQYIRPLFNVWLSQSLGKHYLSKSFHDPSLINHLGGLIEAFPKKKLGTLATVEACQVFMHCYTTLGSHCRAFGSFIARQLKDRTSKGTAFCLDIYKKYSEYFFDPKSHIWLANEAESQGLSLNEIAYKYS